MGAKYSYGNNTNSKFAKERNALKPNNNSGLKLINGSISLTYLNVAVVRQIQIIQLHFDYYKQ